jgi:hypothetical protein
MPPGTQLAIAVECIEPMYSLIKESEETMNRICATALAAALAACTQPALARSANDDAGMVGGGLKSNAKLTAGACYALNSAMTLVAEAGQTRSKSFGGATARMNGGPVGGIIFF